MISIDREMLWQWDYGQRVQLHDVPVGAAVHFSNAAIKPNAFVTEAYEDGEGVYANIPNILLQTAGTLTAYIYLEDGDEGHTEYRKMFIVRDREKPDDYVYTEDDVKTWVSLEERIKALEENGGGGGVSPEELTAAVDAALTEAKESGLFDGAPGKDGQDGAPGDDYVLTEQDKEEIAQMAADAMPSIPEKLPNPNALTFTGAVTATYDGSTPVEVEIPQGGGGSGGGFGLGIADNYDIELITEVYSIDKENMPTRIDITQKDDGTPFAYDGIIIWTDVKDTYSYSAVVFNNMNFLQAGLSHGDKQYMNLYITDGTTMLWYPAKQSPAFALKQSRADVDNTFEPNVHIKNLPEKFTAVSLGAVSAITSITFYKVWGLKKK